MFSYWFIFVAIALAVAIVALVVSVVFLRKSGPRGRTGSQGSGGPTGEGFTGPQGDQGQQGETGPQGLPGSATLTGATGADGLVGPTGPDGILGPTGLHGDTGAIGGTGAAGLAGAAGGTGPTGPSAAGLGFAYATQATGIDSETTPFIFPSDTVGWSDGGLIYPSSHITPPAPNSANFTIGVTGTYAYDYWLEGFVPTGTVEFALVKNSTTTVTGSESSATSQANTNTTGFAQLMSNGLTNFSGGDVVALTAIGLQLVGFRPDSSTKNGALRFIQVA